MPFKIFLRKYMFPVTKTKTITNILEILVGDWKYTPIPWTVILPFYPGVCHE